jgi:hypothetical protein
MLLGSDPGFLLAMIICRYFRWMGKAQFVKNTGKSFCHTGMFLAGEKSDGGFIVSVR